MAKSKSKNALVASGISLLLCISMLIGTTFAWFSDSVSNKGNRIQAGNLKIGFYVSDNNATLPEIGSINADWTDLKLNTDPIFTMGTDNAPAQPGDKLTKFIAIRNEGNIELKYYLDFITNDGGLGDAVTFTLKELYPSTAKTATLTGSQLKNQQITGSSAVKGEYVLYQMDLTFLESAGNTYQGGNFVVDLNLTATQNKQGARDSLIIAKDSSAFSGVAANSTIVLHNDITTTEVVAINEFANIDLNGYTLTCKDFSMIKDDAVGTIDIENGKIFADNIKISAKKGSVNVTNMNGTISSIGKVYLNGSMNTVKLLEGTQFKIAGTENPAPIEIPSETRVVVKTEEQISIAIPSNGKNIVIEDVRANAQKQTINVQVPSGTEGVEINNNPGASAENKIEVTGEGAYDIVEDNVDLKTQIRLTDMWSGTGQVSADNIHSFGYIQFRINRDVDFSKTTAKIDYKFRVNNGEYSLDKTEGQGKTKVTGNFKNGRFDSSKNEYLYSGMLNDGVGKIEGSHMISLADSLISTNDTNPKKRYPEIYKAILDTKGTTDTVEVIAVLTIIDEYNAVQSWTFEPVAFQNGKAVHPGITPPVSQ